MIFKRIMKKFLFASSLILFCLASCVKSKIEIPNHNNSGNSQPPKVESDKFVPPVPDATVAKVETLLKPEKWFIKETVTEGIKFYQFNGTDEVTKARQIVSVVEVDLNNPKYVVDFEGTARDSTSSIMKLCEKKMKKKAWAAVNAAYELEAVYVRIDGLTNQKVTLPPEHLRFWKHEAVVFSDGERGVGIYYGGADGVQAIANYENIDARNIFASAPMLIDDFDPIGKRFVDPAYQEDPDLLKGLDSEHPQYHQGVRHPRTAYALTEDNDLLLIVVDGRWSGKAEGMSAAELTQFIIDHFNPRWAINMDGGGSSTLCVAGRGDDERNLVNYPCQNRNRKPMIQRAVTTHIVIREK